MKDEQAWIGKLTDKELALLRSVHDLIANARHRRTIEVQVIESTVTISIVNREQQGRLSRESLY